MGASFQLEFNSWEEIMIAKITLVSMLAAVAIARPEADPQFYHHGVVGHVHPTCENGADVLPVQSCAPRTEDACVTSDVMSQEIIYVKKCQNVVSKTCALPEIKTKTIETPCAEHTVEHCVDVPEVKEVVTPVETCHVVTKVDCTAAEHSLPKVTCEAGKTEVVDLVATYAG